MSNSLLRLLGTLVLLSMLAACATLPAAQPGGSSPALQPAATTPATAAPSATAVPTATTVPSATAAPVAGPRTGTSLTLDPSLASGINLETLPAVSEGNNNPIWEVAPEHVQISFEGYVIANHLHTPRITIYPVDEFKTASKAANKLVSDL
jgi:hypothetical protein